MATTTPDAAVSEQDGTSEPRKGSPATQRQAAAHKAAQALELRILGNTYDRIALALGYSNRSAAKKAVDRALAAETDAMKASADQWRAQLNLRYERLFNIAANRAIGGSDKALAQAARLLDSIARLNGANAPQTLHITGKFDAEIEALMEELTGQSVEVPAP